MSDVIQYPKALYKGNALGAMITVDDMKAEKDALKLGYVDLSTLEPDDHAPIPGEPLSNTVIL